MMVRTDTYTKMAAELGIVNRFKCCIKAMNVGVIVFIVLISIALCIEADFNSTLFLVLASLITAYQWICMIVWGCSLIKLYRDVAHSKKLLPNKFLFIIHGSLLSAYIIVLILSDIVEYFTN